jgi:hypothetical protein
MQKLSAFLMAAVFACVAATAHAQDYSWDIQDDEGNFITQDQLEDQVNTLLYTFSALAGAGFVNTASLHKVGGLDVRLSFVATPVPEEFADVVPTVKDPLEGADYLAFALLQANLGLPANFEAFARYFTWPTKGEPGGAVTLLGGGLKYGLLRGSLSAPDITLIASYQTLLVPDDFNFGSVKTFSGKAFISKAFTGFTLYGGGGFDRTELALTIELPPGFKTDYNVNSPHGTAGFSFDLIPLLKINLEGNWGKRSSYALGAALSFR